MKYMVIFILFALNPNSADASTAMSCEGKSNKGRIHFFSIMGSPNDPNENPFLDPSLEIDGRKIDLKEDNKFSGKIPRNPGQFITVINKKTDKVMVKILRTGKKATFKLGFNYANCKDESDRDNCWDAQIEFLNGNGKLAKAVLVCTDDE